MATTPKTVTGGLRSSGALVRAKRALRSVGAAGLRSSAVITRKVGKLVGSPPGPFAVNGDWPDYTIVPQMDHYWDLNNGYTDTPGNGKSQLDLTVTGTAGAWGADWAGRANQMLDLTGFQCRMEVANNADLSDLGTTFTVFFELKTNSNLGGGAAFIGGNEGDGTHGWNINFEPSNMYFCTDVVGSGEQKILITSVAADTNYQFVFSYSGGILYYYMNGTLLGSASLQAPQASTGTFYFGGWDVDHKWYRVGILKGTALTTSQVRSLYDTWVNCGSGVYKQHPDAVQTGSLGGFNASGTVSAAHFFFHALAVSGGIIVSGIVSKNSKFIKSVVGGLAVSGILSKLNSFKKSISGGLVVSGALSKINRFSKSVLGGLILSGIVSTIYSHGITMVNIAGGLVVSGVLTKLNGFKKVLAGGLTSSAVMSKLNSFKKAVAGGLTSSGTVKRVGSYLKTLIGGMSISGALVMINKFKKVLIGGLTFAGQVLSHGATQLFFKTITGGLKVSGTIVKSITKPLKGGIVFSGSLTRSKVISILITGGLSFSSFMVRMVRMIIPFKSTAPIQGDGRINFRVKE